MDKDTKSLIAKKKDSASKDVATPNYKKPTPDHPFTEYWGDLDKTQNGILLPKTITEIKAKVAVLKNNDNKVQPSPLPKSSLGQKPPASTKHKGYSR